MRFAVYSKLHHAIIVGVAVLRLTEGICSTNKRTRNDYSPFSQQAFERILARRQKSPELAMPKDRDLRNLTAIFKELLGTSAHLQGKTRIYKQSWLCACGALTVPFRHLPRTSNNISVSGSLHILANSSYLDRVQPFRKAL